MTIKTKIITVTPKDAEKYLAHMVNNRPGRTRHLIKLSASIGRGDWGMTGQPIIFTASGKLLDGQHRMRAVVASGKSVEFLAVYGVDESMYSKIDDCAPRSTADAMVGVPNGQVVAGAIRYVFAEMKCAPGSQITIYNYPITNEQAVVIKDLYPDIIECASVIVGLRRCKSLMGGPIATYCLSRMRSDNEALADEFMRKIHTGEGLAARSPVLCLRNLLSDGVRRDGVLRTWLGPDKVTLIACAWYRFMDRKHGAFAIATARKEWKGWRTPL